MWLLFPSSPFHSMCLACLSSDSYKPTNNWAMRAAGRGGLIKHSLPVAGGSKEEMHRLRWTNYRMMVEFCLQDCDRLREQSKNSSLGLMMYVKIWTCAILVHRDSTRREEGMAMQSAPSKFHHPKQYSTIYIGWAWGRGGEEGMKD